MFESKWQKYCHVIFVKYAKVNKHTKHLVHIGPLSSWPLCARAQLFLPQWYMCLYNFLSSPNLLQPISLLLLRIPSAIEEGMVACVVPFQTCSYMAEWFCTWCSSTTVQAHRPLQCLSTQTANCVCCYNCQFCQKVVKLLAWLYLHLCHLAGTFIQGDLQLWPCSEAPEWQWILG